jgi:hypothetical protein
MWSNIWAGLGPTRPKEGTTWFRAGPGYCFYTSGWHDTAQKSFGLCWPEPVWHEARWAWAGLVRPGPIPSTTLAYDGTKSGQKGCYVTEISVFLSYSVNLTKKTRRKLAKLQSTGEILRRSVQAAEREGERLKRRASRGRLHRHRPQGGGGTRQGHQ